MNAILTSCRKVMILIITFFITHQITAQQFITPYESEFVPSQQAYIITQNGEQVTGNIRAIVSLGRGIKSVTIMLTTGEKMKFRADEIQELAIRNNGLTQAISTVEQSASIRKAVEADWNQIYHQEYITYEKVKLPSGKHAMMQKINPGFDSRIKVYYSQGSRKTTGIGVPVGGPASPINLKLTGGRQRAYWVSKDNGKVFKVKRGSYNRKKFRRLFGDSPEMLETHGRPYRFSEFSDHVYMYDKLNQNK